MKKDEPKGKSGKKSEKKPAANKKSNITVSVVEELDNEDVWQDEPPTISKTFSSHPTLHKAQDKMDEAYEAHGLRRVQLAKEAIILCEDCIEAYLLISQENANLDEAIEYAQKAVAAGERLIVKYANDLDPRFYWSASETRIYMMALQTLAKLFELKGDVYAAIDLYQKLLKINPKDNQSVRYLLAPCLLEAERYPELKKLLKETEGDPSAWLYFTRALYLFKTSGPGKAAQAALNEAIQYNPFVLQFLAGLLELPEEEPELIGLGEETEAAAYVMQYGYQWEAADGALEWLSETTISTINQVFNDPNLRDIAMQELMAGLAEEFGGEDDESGPAKPKNGKHKSKPKR